MDEFIKVENKVDEKEFLSPLGNYKLIVEFYKTGEKTWNYTKGILTRISDNKIITEIIRNYSGFSHSFFIKNGQEWLQTGKTYMSQIFVNLDTEEIFDNEEELKQNKIYKFGKSFCWVECSIS